MKKDFFIIAGPCVVESKEILYETANELKRITTKLDIKLIFKSSYKKANRTSISSFMGLGDETALCFLAEIREKLGLQVLTDVHSVEDVNWVSEYVDILQIPAFLCRQTDLLVAAGKTGKTINIKKGQFLAPEAMKLAAEKVSSTGNKSIWLTERGTCFGYHDLVVDFRSLIIMKQFGYPVVYDATHSVQQPSVGLQSGGLPIFIEPLAKAAAAVGIDGLFFETHPDPTKALSDAATQMKLNNVEKFLTEVVSILNSSK